MLWWKSLSTGPEPPDRLASTYTWNSLQRCTVFHGVAAMQWWRNPSTGLVTGESRHMEKGNIGGDVDFPRFSGLTAAYQTDLDSYWHVEYATSLYDSDPSSGTLVPD
jgi:hypothetical protein